MLHFFKRTACWILVFTFVFSCLISSASAIDFSLVFKAGDEKKLDDLYSSWDIIDGYEPSVLKSYRDDKTILSEMYEFISELDTVKRVVWESDYHFSFQFKSGLWSEYHRFPEYNEINDTSALEIEEAVSNVKEDTAVGKKAIGVYSPYYGSDSSMTKNYLEAANKAAEKLGADWTVESWYGTGYSWSTGAGNVNSFKNCGNYGAIIIDSHGSSNSTTGLSYIWLPNPGSYDNSDIVDGSLVYSSGKIGLSGKFISKYCTMDNTFIYMGICEGMKQLGTAQALLNAGAGFVCGYTESVSFTYDGQIMPSICETLSTICESDSTRTYNALEACQKAKESYGAYDPYASYRAVLTWVGNNDLSLFLNRSPITGISFTESSVDIYYNNTYSLEYETVPVNAGGYTLKWSSSNPAVASIDEASGVITANTQGTSVITVVATNNLDINSKQGETYTASATVNVLGNMPLSGLSLSPQTLELCVDSQPVAITPEFTPQNASNKAVSWRIIDDTIASVDAEGVVTPKQSGKTRVIAVSEDGGYVATAVVNVANLNTAINTEGGSITASTTASYPWKAAIVEGRLAARSGNSGHGSTSSSMYITVYMEVNQVFSFDYMTGTEEYYDVFNVYASGTRLVSDASGSSDWENVSYTKTGSAGNVNFTFTYTKESSVDRQSDCVWIDNCKLSEVEAVQEPIQGEQFYSDGFEVNPLISWQTRDMDSDGNSWSWTTTAAAYSGNSCVASVSYDESNYTAFSPDNWLISKAIELPEGTLPITLSWYAKGLSSFWTESYSVYIGETDDIELMTEIFSGITSGDYTRNTVDLSSYKGKTVYIAFRHSNSVGQGTLFIDMVELYGDSKAYTISYFIDGALFYSEKLAEGAAIIPPTAPEKTGYTFAGWQSVPEVMPSNDISIFGSYTVNVYSVTFVDGISGDILSVQQVEYGKNAAAPEALPHTGYTFIGWDGDGISITSDTTITAMYERNSYTVTFIDGFDGTLISTNTVLHGDNVELPSVPTHEGYTFVGWDNDGMNITADLAITANYNRNEYTVTFVDGLTHQIISESVVLHGESAVFPEAPEHEGYYFIGWDKTGTGIASDTTITAQYDIKVYMVTFIDGYDQTVISQTAVSHGENAVFPVEPTHEGYSFTGWNNEGIGITEDTTITAIFERNSYTVTFVDGLTGETILETEVLYEDNAVFPEVPTHEGYSFIGWDNAGTNITQSIAITASYEKNKYTVTFVDSLTDELIATAEVLYNESVQFPDAPTHEGYIFTGWDNVGTEIKADITIKALYERKTYTVTFVDGITESEIGTSQVQHGDSVEFPAVPEHEGYTFIGWDNTGINIVSDITITAEYTLLSFNVTLTDGVDGSTIAVIAVLYGEDIEFPEPPKHTGYEFIGWSADGKEITEDTTITALYSVLEYKVTFIDGVTKETIAEKKVEYGKDTVFPTPPVHEGYVFVEWDNDGKNITKDTTITAIYKAEGTEPLLGDVNGDSKLNTGDATFILKYAIGAYQIPAGQEKAADINGDGKINTGDATMILKKIANG